MPIIDQKLMACFIKIKKINKKDMLWSQAFDICNGYLDLVGLKFVDIDVDLLYLLVFHFRKGLVFALRPSI